MGSCELRIDLARLQVMDLWPNHSNFWQSSIQRWNGSGLRVTITVVDKGKHAAKAGNISIRRNVPRLKKPMPIQKQKKIQNKYNGNVQMKKCQSKYIKSKQAQKRCKV